MRAVTELATDIKILNKTYRHIKEQLLIIKQQHCQQNPDNKIGLALDLVANKIDQQLSKIKAEMGTEFVLSPTHLSTEQAARKLIHLTSIADIIKTLAHQFSNEQLQQLAVDTLEKVRQFRQQSDQLDSAYFDVKITTTMTQTDRRKRRQTTGRKYSTFAGSVSEAPVNTMVAPFTRHQSTRHQIEQGNKTLSYQLKSVRVTSNSTVDRLRLDTEHNQSINVFRATLVKDETAMTNGVSDCLHVIAVHGNASCAVGELPARIKELDRVLSQSQSNKMILLVPDLPGSVASGGEGKTLGEVSQNGVEVIVHTLLKQGVHPANILIRGHSLGGLISTKASYVLMKQGIHVSLCSVDSLARVQRFTKLFVNSEIISNVVGRVALEHWNEPAFQYFEQLAPDRRFCIHKKGDSVIPLICSALFALDGNSSVRQDCYLLDNGFNHNDDIVQLGDDNPAVGFFVKVDQTRHKFKKRDWQRLVKIVKGHAGAQVQNTDGNNFYQANMALFAELETFIQPEQDLPIEQRYDALMVWLRQNHLAALDSYKTAKPRYGFLNLYHKPCPFLESISNIIKAIKADGYYKHIWLREVEQANQKVSNADQNNAAAHK